MPKLKNNSKSPFILEFGGAHTGAPQAPAAFLKQVHGTTCRLVDAATSSDTEGDIILTRTPGLAIGVVTADCAPLALYDEKNHAAAMVHAGWRGAVAGVVQQALKSMHDHFGTIPQNVLASIGPCALH